MISTSRQCLGAFIGGDPILSKLEEDYGSHFEKLNKYEKIVFRSALSMFVANAVKWIQKGSGITCMEFCIESSNCDLWDDNPQLCEAIQSCADLKPDDIDGLIEFLTHKIRYTQEVK
jgi:hypothetical protein